MNCSLLLAALTCLAMTGCRGEENANLAPSEFAYCEQAKSAFASARDIDESVIAGCDEGSEEVVGSERYQLLRLNGHCREEICGSVLMGWLAVNKRSGLVFEWDVGDWRLGDRVARSD